MVPTLMPRIGEAPPVRMCLHTTALCHVVYTAMHKAAANGHLHIVRLLLQHNAVRRMCVIKTCGRHLNTGRRG